MVAAALDKSVRVHAWAKNVRLGFTIPYKHQGRSPEFTPDFLCVLRDDSGGLSDQHLVIEVKGLEREPCWESLRGWILTARPLGPTRSRYPRQA